MRIAVDALPLHGDMGTSVYLKNLLPRLVEMGRRNRFTLCYRGLSRSGCSPVGPEADVSRRRIKVPNRLLEYLWIDHEFKLPGVELAFGNPDVFFATMYFAPAFKKCRIVPVLYDTSPLELEEYAGAAREFFIRHAGVLIKRATHAVAISASAKNDFCRRFGCNPDSITVTPLAAPPGFAPSGKTDKLKRVLSKYHLPEKYILYVGNFGPHKNIPRLIRVFAALKRRRAIEQKLVLCGRTTWAAAAMESIRRERMASEVHLTGHVPDEDLPLIYSGADLFVFCSLYEGFGLPIVEAMSCGVPVIASRTSSMPEVVGSAGILVDPLDEASMAEAIAAVANDETRRREMSADSLSRAARFDWRRTAELTLKAFEKAAA